MLALDDPRVELILDPDPHHALRSPWRTYRHALETTPASATHRLVVQDDVEVCRSFAAVAELAIRARPDRLVSFFVGGMPREHARSLFAACDRGDSWAELDNLRWCPAVCLAWPVELIPELLEHVDRYRWQDAGRWRADDEIIGRWCRETRRRPLATVPSLVEHPDDVASLIGRRAANGTDPGRVAACFIDEAVRDPLEIDWSLGPA